MKPLNDDQKFRIIHPITLRIANFISLHGTEQFYKYRDEMEEVEKKIRRDVRVFNVHNNNSNDTSEENIKTFEVLDEFITETQSSESNINDLVPVEENTDDETSSPNSRFTKIIFKEAVKTKGRPKRKKRQVNFKRTVIGIKKKATYKKSKQIVANNLNDYSDESLILITVISMRVVMGQKRRRFYLSHNL